MKTFDKSYLYEKKIFFIRDFQQNCKSRLTNQLLASLQEEILSMDG